MMCFALTWTQGHTPLHRAVATGDIETAALVCSIGAVRRPNLPNAHPVTLNLSRFYCLALPSPFGRTCLTCDAVPAIHPQDANAPDVEQRTPLMWAADRLDEDMVRMLLSQGATICMLPIYAGIHRPQGYITIIAVEITYDLVAVMTAAAVAAAAAVVVAVTLAAFAPSPLSSSSWALSLNPPSALPAPFVSRSFLLLTRRPLPALLLRRRCDTPRL